MFVLEFFFNDLINFYCYGLFTIHDNVLRTFIATQKYIFLKK